MTAHTREQREFIALRLARFEPPDIIIAAFRLAWSDTDCTEDDIRSCDPARGGILAPETLDKFRAVREHVLTDPSSAPTADRRARLIMLHQELERARERRQLPVMLEILARIAIESAALTAAGPASAGNAPITEIRRVIVRPEPATPAAA